MRKNGKGGMKIFITWKKCWKLKKSNSSSYNEINNFWSFPIFLNFVLKFQICVHFSANGVLNATLISPEVAQRLTGLLKVTFLKSEAICVLIRYADVEGGYESFHSFEFSTKTPFLTFLKGLVSREHNEKIVRKVSTFQNWVSKKVFCWKWAIIDHFQVLIYMFSMFVFLFFLFNICSHWKINTCAKKVF